MSNLTIFGLGLFVTLLLAAGLFFTVLEFRDIDRHPEQHEPKSFRKKSIIDVTTPSLEPSSKGRMPLESCNHTM